MIKRDDIKRHEAILISRNEYPRPQLVRKEWVCLNGEWQLEIDNSKSGKEKEFF